MWLISADIFKTCISYVIGFIAPRSAARSERGYLSRSWG